LEAEALGMQAVDRETPGATVGGAAMARALSIFAELEAGVVTLQCRTHALLLGTTWEDTGLFGAAMISGVAEGVLAPVDVRRDRFQDALAGDGDHRLRLVGDELVVDGGGVSRTVPARAGSSQTPDLLDSRLGRHRSSASIRADHACMLAGLVADGHGGSGDGIVISPDGWAGTGDGEQLAVAPLERWSNGHEIVVPGRLFRAVRGLDPDEVEVEINRRQDDPRLVRMMAFSGRDMLVVEAEAVHARFPDLREILTRPARVMVEVADADALRSALADFAHCEHVLLRPGAAGGEAGGGAEVVGRSGPAPALSMPFDGVVHEAAHVRTRHFLDFLSSHHGRVELCCDDPLRQPLCGWAEDGSIRGLLALPMAG
jgi:hypothetical protein